MNSVPQRRQASAMAGSADCARGGRQNSWCASRTMSLMEFACCAEGKLIAKLTLRSFQYFLQLTHIQAHPCLRMPEQELREPCKLAHLARLAQLHQRVLRYTGCNNRGLA
jgi:hypothetical protein